MCMIQQTKSKILEILKYMKQSKIHQNNGAKYLYIVPIYIVPGWNVTQNQQEVWWNKAQSLSNERDWFMMLTED